MKYYSQKLFDKNSIQSTCTRLKDLIEMMYLRSNDKLDKIVKNKLKHYDTGE